MSLKTLHLTNAWHRCSGGIGTFYRALLEAANRHGHHLRLVVPGESTWVEEAGEYGRIYHLRAPQAPVNGGYRILYPHRFLFPGTAIQRIINEERPDLIEVSEKYSMPYLAGLLRVRGLPGVNFQPTVVGLSCERMDENMAAYVSRSSLAKRFCGVYMKWIYFPMFDHHIAVSEHAAEELRPASRGHKVRRGVWIRPMGVDCDRFTPARRSTEGRRALIEKTHGDERSVLLLYAGRVVPEKNLGLLVDMMERLREAGGRDYRLLIAGQGMALDALRQACSMRAPGAVTFLGHVAERDALADLFANADAFVHPNPREPFGIAPLEAMASGLPLAAPNSGGVTSYASPANAWLAEPDGFAYAAAVREIANGGEARDRKVSAALQTAAGLRWDAVAADFLRLYGELHARSRGRQADGAMPAQFYSTLGNIFGRETAF
jgi:alpha-1,6-mannosyltransferase